MDPKLPDFSDIVKIVKDNPAPTVFFAVGIFFVVVFGWVLRSRKESFEKGPSLKEPIWVGFIIGALSLILSAITSFFSFISADTVTKKIEDVDALLIMAFAVITYFGVYTIRKRLRELIAAEKQLVAKVEDATRSILEGFPAIFHKSYLMIQEAEREIWYVNFLLRFGAPHCYNKRFVDAYKDLYPSALCGAGNTKPGEESEKKHVYDSGDVWEFYETLKDKVANKNVKNVQILTLSFESVRDQFLSKLSQNTSAYPDLSVNICDNNCGLLKTIQENDAYFRRKDAWKSQKDRGNAYDVYETTNLPIQLLITGLPGNRVGCLVFMVGTETRSDIESGQEFGFYTELEQVVKIYRNFAAVLMKGAKHVAPPPT